MSSYCDFAEQNPLHKAYHDQEYGFPETDETRLCERLSLEIMQAGLNWGLILKKRDSLNQAFSGFEVDKLLAFDETDRARLLADPGIIRNRLKIDAILHNARVIADMRENFQGGFAGFLASHHPRTKEEWVRLFKKTFRFTGGEITGEFLMSIGYLSGTHRPDCPIAQKITALHPPWMQV